jgi:hypothetical protein
MWERDRKASREVQAAQARDFVDDPPGTTMGKVQKNILREQFSGLYALEEDAS